MPYKDPKKQKLAQRQYYLNNKQKYADVLKYRRLRNKQYAWDVKHKIACKYCGENDPCCLNFHHIDSHKKVNTVAQLIRNATSLKKLQEEIDKCEVVCVNCHRVLHYMGGSLSTKSNKVVRWYQAYKNSLQCDKCGKSGDGIIDFHHINDDKLFSVGNRKLMRHLTKDDILKEIQKCIPVCGNCHCKIHHQENNTVV